MHIRRIRGWLVRSFDLFHRKQSDREFAEELESHLAMHVEDNVRAGMTAEEARRRALIKIGGVAQIKELHREQRGLPMLETLLQDFRFGVRMLLKHRGFALLTIFTLAMGIGANTAIFSVVDAVILRPLPYRDPDRLVKVFETNSQRNVPRMMISQADFQEWKTRNRSFEEMAARMMTSFRVAGGAVPEEVSGNIVSSLNKNQPIREPRTMAEIWDGFTVRPRFYLTLLGSLAALATLLAATGIYGVLSHIVSRRTHEIGVRRALGAQDGDVLWLVIKQGMMLATPGVAIGLGVALALTRLMQGWLYEVSVTDPTTFITVSVLLILVALNACYAPARRATKVDPLTALRRE